LLWPLGISVKAGINFSGSDPLCPLVQALKAVIDTEHTGLQRYRL